MAHILMAIRNLTGGGAERMVLWTTAGLEDRGHRVDIAIFDPTIAYTVNLPSQARLMILCGQSKSARWQPDTLPKQAYWRSERIPLVRTVSPIAKLVARYGIRCLTVFPQPRVLEWACRLAHYFEHEQPDIVFGNLGHSEFAALLGVRMAFVQEARPPVVSIQHLGLKSGTSYARYVRCLSAEFAHHVTVSHAVAESLSSTCHVPEEKITTIHNPVDLTSIARQAAAPTDHPWFSDGGPPVILSAGRLEPRKEFFTLLDAFHILRRSGHDCRLLVLGEGVLRGALEDRVQALGLEDQVSLPGWVENPFSYMSRSALFVLASRWEGFGMVLAEAMACGCPAVATDCPGPPEILQDPDLLAPVGDPDALAQVMLRVLNRPRNREEMRAKSAQFSVERCAAAYETLIARVLAEAKSQECKANRHSS